MICTQPALRIKPLSTILYSRSAGRENIDMVTDSILTLRTHYEKMFLEEGLKINYLAFRLEKDKIIYDGWKETGFK